MAFIISTSDNSKKITIDDNVIDDSTYSISLVGRNSSNYGRFIAQNAVRMLDNFASEIAPSSSEKLIGQLWYDKNSRILRVWDGEVWKQANSMIVDYDYGRPTTHLYPGSMFYNLTTSQLEIHDGNSFKKANPNGEVTNAYANSVDNGSPEEYGAIVRTVFLKELSSGKYHPVVMTSYVKSADAGNTSTDNLGHTNIGGRLETVMSIISDEEFIVDAGSTVEVDGNLVALPVELVAAGGVASERPGRVAGLIKKGLNVRNEYEEESVFHANVIYATEIYKLDATGNVIVEDAGNIAGDLFVDGTITANVDILAMGNITSTNDLISSANLTVAQNVNVNGDIYANAVFQTSDVALKDFIEPIMDPLHIIDELNGRTYIWKDTGDQDYGVIAQEIEQIMPELVDINNEGYKVVRYDGIIPVLVEGVKALKRKYNEEREKVIKLENQFQYLDKLCADLLDEIDEIKGR